MMRAGDVQAFAGVLASNPLATAYHDALTICREQAINAKKAVRCAIQVKTQE